jgi:hypothetical protein
MEGWRQVGGDVRIRSKWSSHEEHWLGKKIFLLLFHRPVTKRVKKEVCVDPKDSPAGFRNGTKDGLRTVEIDIEVGAFCLQTSTSYASQRPQR